jgi:hypothetical protein
LLLSLLSLFEILSLSPIVADAAAAAVVFSTLPQKPKTLRFGFRCLVVPFFGVRFCFLFFLLQQILFGEEEEEEEEEM